MFVPPTDSARRGSRGSGPIFTFFLVAILGGAAAHAQLYVSNDDGVIHVDVATGDRTVVSDGTTGSGPALTATGGIAVLNESTLYLHQFTGPASMQLLAVDIATGNRTLVSETGDSLGADWYQAYGLAFDDSGNLYTYDDDVGFIVWPAAGNGVNAEQVAYDPPGLGIIYDLVSDGTYAYFVDYNLQLVAEGDLAGNMGRIVTNSSVGSGDPMITPFAIDFIDANTLVIVGESTAMSVDIATGARTIISGGPPSEIPVGSGPEFTFANDVIAGPNGTIYVLDTSGETTIYAIDPATGNRSIVSGAAAGVGSGPVLTGSTMDYGVASGGSDPIPTVPAGAPLDTPLLVGLAAAFLLGAGLLVRRRMA